MPLPAGASFVSAPIAHLQIRVISGRNLIAADVGGTSDPFVKIRSPSGASKEVKTKVQNKTLNPVWNETFVITLGNAVHDLVLVEVYDHDKIGSNDCIGFVAIDPSKLPFGQEVLTDENLSWVPHGEVKLAITAQNFGIQYHPPQYLNDYSIYRNSLPGMSKKGLEKSKKKEKKSGHKAAKGTKASGPYTGKACPPGYSIKNGWVKKDKSAASQAGKEIGKGLKKLGKLL
ncbi:hypothetical protein DICPUDRAFT_44765 [Dictyostelium purpureum]|uniref:C2 domain-containing protein n=1 Tax=Dictyostelium purpureum TaxID=5786 RepID=F0Z7I9_DICPU|nr:uncharacterized protein DICPUDRAFT_44765 [Dictyostelium purpureum]EGC40068.1 hypothetical protein DICPUDRAFT_44765 [Dictyostelium purpureum]|eukprot:XP_003283417.1 hypothetical protein DICPUDRAFT_44765 [Dictyostelium purpureum]